METFKKTNPLHLLLLNLTLSILCAAQPTPTSFCGKIRIQTPFTLLKSVESSSPVNRMLLCRSHKVYFRTSLGLFPISSIDYRAKTLTISHSSCTSSLHYVSPSLLSAGFPSPPQPNSLLLFNCLNRTKSFSPFLRNCTRLHDCGPSPKQEPQGISSCLFVHDSEKLEMGFDPKDLGCSHYNRVYRDTSTEGFQLGTRVSFDIPDHVPNICSECTKPKGNCGVGLRCICHPKQCKDKVFSGGISTNPSLLSIIIMVVLFMSC